jgi:hypothetical protein
LTLGEKLEQHDRDQEAYDNYQELLQEATGYPGRTSIYQKLLAAGAEGSTNRTTWPGTKLLIR